jgi:GT2 family glycosyltransferase
VNEQGVTVVVPTLNRGSFLHDCMRDLLAQTHRPLEILVVDQSGSVDPVASKLAADHPGIVSYHHVGFRGLPQARNYGWQCARFEAVLFVDDDVCCAPRLVSEHLRALRIPGVGLVGGAIDEAHRPIDKVSRTGSFNPWTATPARGFAASGEFDVDHAPGGNFSLWRTAIRQAGGVDEALSAGAALYEETDLCLRIKQAGFRVYFNGDARLTHLATHQGGCRMEQVSAYTGALAYNRCFLIRRHVRWYQTPVALGRLLLLVLSYARAYRAPAALAAGLVGCVQGLRKGGCRPTYTRYCTENP